MTELLDERVVEMRFDNKDFETNVNQSIKTIDKLKKSLNFKDAGESLDSLSSAAEKVDLSSVENSVEQITVKFNLLEAVAAGVLTNIVNKAVDAGSRLVKSMTIDQVTAGWNKYESKTQSVQTIMAATGQSINSVNAELERLIWFADETSYSFTDMVNNVGKFTSAGVPLERAVNSMMGISNWAALSGAGIQQASRAMYNLSQAMGIGYVGLMDWKSIELANMATIDFKESVIETAVALGTLRQEADGTIKTAKGTIITAETMRSSLNEKWFTSEVLEETLNEYASFTKAVEAEQDRYTKEYGHYVSVKKTIELMEMEGYDTTTKAAQAFIKAQEALSFTQVINATADAVSSGWMRTFELIFGNYEKAKKLWTELANDMWDIFAESGETRNEMLTSIMDSKYQQMLDEMPDGEEFNNRLRNALYDLGKKYGRSEEVLDDLFDSYATLEDMLQDQNGIISEIDLSEAFEQLYKDYAKDAKTAETLSGKLDKDKDLLKNVIVGFAHGYYGKDLEDARKRLEELGWTNLDQLQYYAEEYASGMQLNWDEVNKEFKDSLEYQKETYSEFANYLYENSPTEGFLSGLLELGGRDKLQAGFSSIIKNLKNTYRLILSIVDSISSLFGGGSFLGSIIDGFYKVTTLFTFTDDKFEEVSNNIHDFITVKAPNWLDRFLHGVHTELSDFDVNMLEASGIEVPVDFMFHENGLIDTVKELFHNYFAKLPAEVAAPIENARQKVSGFFNDVQTKISEFRDKYIPKIGTSIDASTGKVTKFIASGGIFDIIKEKIRGIGEGFGGKVIDGIANFLKKIGDWLFGYEKDGEVIEGHIGAIFDKVTALINMLKTIGKRVKDIISDIKTFFFGGKYTFSDAVIYNIFDRLGLKFEKLKQSKAYQDIHRFFFGEKSEDGTIIKNNIFGKIGTAISTVTSSNAFKSMEEFLFGKKTTIGAETDEKTGKLMPVYKRIGGVFNGIIEIIQAALTDMPALIQTITDSSAFKAIKEFFFGKETSDPEAINNGLFARIDRGIKLVADSSAFKAVKAFFFGDESAEEGSDKKLNIFGKIKRIITEITESQAFKDIKAFFFGEKNEDGSDKKLNIFGKIKRVITEITESPAFKAIKAFIFGDEKSSTPSIFGRIGQAINSLSKQPAFIAIKEFFFGDGEEKKSGISGVIESIKNGFQEIWDSNPFKAIWKFFFGDEPINENVEAVTNPTHLASGKGSDSAIHQASYTSAGKTYQILGDDGRPVELPAIPKQTGFQKFLSNIQKAIKSVTDSKAYKEIKKFIFGIKSPIYKDTGELVGFKTYYPSILDRFRKLIDGFIPFLKDTKNKIADFLFGPIDKNGNRTENIFKRLPGYIHDAQNAVKVFFTGGTYEKTGATVLPLLDRLKLKIEEIKAKNPWFATFCSFIENELKNIKGLFDNAGGSITLFLSNLNSYLFGGDVKKKNPLTGEVEILEKTNGIITDIRENIYKLFHGGKEKKNKNFFTDIIDNLGLGKPSVLNTVGKIILTLLGLNVLFTKFDLGNLGEWGFKSVFEQMTESLAEFAKGLLMISGAFILLVFASKLIKNDFKAGLFAITIVGLLKKFLLDAVKELDDKRKVNPTTMLTIKFITDAITQLTILLAAFTLFLKFGKISNGDLLKAVGIIGVLFLLIGKTGKMMTTVAKEGQQVKTAAGAFFGLAAVLYAVANLLSTLAMVFVGLHLVTKGKDFNEFANALELMKIGLIAIAAMIAVIALAIGFIGAVAKNVNGSTVGLTISLMASLIFLTISLGNLLSVTKNLAWEQIAVVFGGLSTVLLSMTACIAVLSGIKKLNKSSIGAIVMLPILVAACGGIVYGLSILAEQSQLFSKWKNLAAFFATMAAVILMMLPVIGIFALLGTMKKSINDDAIASFGEIILALIEVVLVIATISFVISRIGLPKVSQLAAFIMAMAAVIVMLLPMIGVFRIIKIVKESINSEALGGFTLLMLALSEVVALVAGITYLANAVPFKSWGNVGQFIAVMAAVVGSMAVIPYIFKQLAALDKYNSKTKSKELFDYKRVLTTFSIMSVAVIQIGAVALILSFGIAKAMPYLEFSFENLCRFIPLLGAVIGVMSLLPRIFGLINNPDLQAKDNFSRIVYVFSALSIAVAEISAAVFVMALATAILPTSTLGQLIQFLILLTAAVNVIALIPGILFELERYAKSTEKLDWKETAKRIGVLCGALIAIGAVVFGLAWLIHLMPTDKNAIHFDQISAFLILMLAFIGVLRLIPIVLNGLDKAISKTEHADSTTLLGRLAIIIGAVFVISLIASIFYVMISALPDISDNKLISFIALIATLTGLCAAVGFGLAFFTKYANFIKESDLKLFDKFLLRITAVIGILIIGISLIAFALSKLPNINWTGVYAFLGAIGAGGILLLVISRITFSILRMSKYFYSIDKKDTKQLGKFIATIAGMLTLLTVLVGLLVLVAPKLSNVSNIYPLIGAIGVTGVLFLALSGLAALMSRISKWGRVFNNFTQILKLFGAVTVILAAITGVVAGLAWVSTKIENLDNIGKLLISIIKVAGAILALSVIITAIGFVATIGKGVVLDAAIFMAEIIVVITVIGLIVGAIGWLLKKIEEVEAIGKGGIVESINQFGDMFEALMNALGKGIGGFMGGIGEGLTDSLPILASNLSAFMTNLSLFLVGISNLDETHRTGIGILSDVMVGILEAEFYGFIAGVLEHLGAGGDLPLVIGNFKTLVENDLMPFLGEVNKLKDTDKDQLDLFNEIMKKLLVADFFSKIAGVLDHLGPNGDLPGVVSNLKTMVQNDLKPFLQEISTLQEKDKGAFDTFNEIMLKIMEASFLDKVASVISLIGGSDSQTSKIVKGFKDLYNNDLKPFIDTLKENVNLEEDKEAISEFNQIMLDIMGAAFLDKVTSLISKIGGEDSQTSKIVKGFKDLYNNDLKPFIDTLKQNINIEEDTRALGNFNQIMLNLTGAEFFDKVTSLISKIGGEDSQTSKVVKGLSALFTNDLRPFITKAATITDSDIKAVGNFNSVMRKILNATIYAKISDLISAIGDNNNLGTVITKLKDAVSSNALIDFLTEVRNIKSDDSTYTGYFSDVMQNIVGATFYGEIAGIIEKLGTDTSIGTLVTKLKDGVTDLKPFLEAVRDIKSDDPTYVGYFTSIMSKIAGATFYSKLSSIILDIGKNGMKDVFTDMGSIADDLPLFLEKVKSLTKDDVTGTQRFTSIMESLTGATFYGKLSQFIGSFGSTESYEQYKTDLVYLAEAANEISGKVENLDTGKVNDAVAAIKGLLGLAVDSRFKSGGLLSGINTLIEGKTNFGEFFDIILGTSEDGNDGLLHYLKEVIAKIDENGITAEDLRKISNVANTIQTVFDLLAFDARYLITDESNYVSEYDSTQGMYNAADNLVNALQVLRDKVVPEIIGIYDDLKAEEVDGELIKNTIGPIAELLKVLSELSEFGIDTINISEIGSFIITGLVTALDEGVEKVKAAAKRVADGITEGLTLTLQIQSPSRVTYAIGQFVAQGLYNGIAAGAPMNYKLAQMFGEHTIESLEKGLSQHTFNMVTMDLVDENIFNMPDFMDEIGNIDFDKMSAFLHEKFDEALGSDYINGFVGQMRKDWKQIPETLDETRTAIVQRISSGEFGSGQDAILAALEEELGSIDAATAAWNDYNNVLSENVRMNETLIKQRKENPPMTYEEYMEMVEHAQEGLDLLNSGEIDRLAAQNGTTREQELSRLGYDAALTQRMANDYYSQFFTYLTKEQWEEMFAARDFAEEVNSETEKTKKVTETATEALESEAEALDSVNKTAGKAARAIDNVHRQNVFAGKEKRPADAAAEELDEDTSKPNKLGRGVTTLTDREKRSIIADAEEIGEAQSAAVDRTVESAERANAQNGEWMMNLESSAADAKTEVETLAEEVESFDDSFNFKRANEWITNLRNGTESLSDDAIDQLELLRQEVFTKGSYFKHDEKGNILYGVESQQHAIQELQALGLTTANAQWMLQEASNFNFKQANEELKTSLKTQKEITEATEAAGDASEKASTKTTELSQSYETLGEKGQLFADSISFNDEGNKINIDLQNIIDGLTTSEKKDFFNGLSETLNLSDYGIKIDGDKIELPENFKGLEFDLPENTFVKNTGKDFISEILKFANGGTVLGAFGREFNVGDILNFIGKAKNIKNNGFFGVIQTVADLVSKVKKDTEDLNSQTIEPEFDTGQMEYACNLIEEYKKDVKEAAALEAVTAIQNGDKVTALQQEQLENMYYNAVLGFYGQNEKITETLQSKYGITWEELQSLFLPGGHFDTSRSANPYLDYADKINAQIQEGSKDYTTLNLFQDIADGLWGTDAERKEALKAAKYDVDKILPMFNKWLTGSLSAEEFSKLGDHYGRLTDAEIEAKEETERLNEVLNSTPEGAFKAVGDFLSGVEAAIKDTGNAEKFNKFINDVVGNLKSIELPNASAFESVGNFLKMVKSVSAGSTGISTDFGTLMNQLETSLNSVEFKTDQFGPLNEFFANLVDVSDSISDTLGPFTNFLDDVINISESEISDNAAQAATTLVMTLLDTFAKYYNDFAEIGRSFVMYICAGMMSRRRNLIDATQTLAGTILSGFKEHAIDKAADQGREFIGEFTTAIGSEESKQQFKDAISSLFMQSEEEAAEGAADTATPGKVFAQQFMQDFSEGITTDAVGVTTAFSTMVSNMTTSLGSLDGISASVQTAMMELPNGIMAGLEAASEPLLKAVGTIHDILASAVPDGYSMGKDFATGLVQGMQDGMEEVFGAGFALGNSALDGTADASKTASPSREFMKLGRFMDEGLAIGINKNSGAAYDAGYELGGTVESSVRDSLDMHSPSEVLKDLGWLIPESMAIGIEKNINIVTNAVQRVSNVVTDSAIGMFDKIEKFGEAYDKSVSDSTRNYLGGFTDVSSMLNSIRNGLGNTADSIENQLNEAGKALKDYGNVTEEQADRILNAWNEIMLGKHGVIGPNGTGERDKYLDSIMGGLTWNELYAYSDGRGHLDKNKLLNGMNKNVINPLAEVFKGVYSGKFGGGSEWFAAIENLKIGEDEFLDREAFTQALQAWWDSSNKDVTSFEDAADYYYEILDQMQKAAEETGQATADALSVEPVISPVYEYGGKRYVDPSSYIAAVRAAQQTATNVQDQKNSTTPSETPAGQTVINNTYNQTNNSPKPLNRAEIYRQTRNQFSQISGFGVRGFSSTEIYAE